MSAIYPSRSAECAPPRGHRLRELVQHLRLRAPGALEHREAVVRALDHVERGTSSEPRGHRGDELEIREIVPGALEEQHGDGHPIQVLATRDTGALGRVQREAYEDEAGYPF